MRHAAEFRLAFVLSISLLLASALPAPAQPAAEEAPTPQRTHLSRVKHIIVVMQENHSFDNYFGVLPYAVGSPYRGGPCRADDHACVDSLSCSRHPKTGAYHCNDTNRDDDKEKKVESLPPRRLVRQNRPRPLVGRHAQGGQLRRSQRRTRAQPERWLRAAQRPHESARQRRRERDRRSDDGLLQRGRSGLLLRRRQALRAGGPSLQLGPRVDVSQ